MHSLAANLPPEKKMAMCYAGMAQVLANVSIRIHDEDEREMVEQALSDWCELTDWSLSQTLDRFDLHPPQ